MRKLIAGIVIALGLTYGLAYAFMPGTFSSTTQTKADKSVSISGKKAIMFRTTATNMSFVIGTGTAYPMNANTDVVLELSSGQSAIVFSSVSSVAKTINYITK